MKVLETQDPELWGQNSLQTWDLQENIKTSKGLYRLLWEPKAQLDVLAVAGCVTPSSFLSVADKVGYLMGLNSVRNAERPVLSTWCESWEQLCLKGKMSSRVRVLSESNQLWVFFYFLNFIQFLQRRVWKHMNQYSMKRNSFFRFWG